MSEKRDYYEVLGVERDADERTIKRAFLRLARTLHPDVNSSPDAEQRFKEVNEAYSVLSDERKRANYDRFGTPDGPVGFGSDYVDMSDIFGGSGFGFSDIFDSFFGGAAGGGARAQRTRGRDMGITLRITLEEAAAGCTKTVAYDRLAPCEDCGGTGAQEDGHEVTCSRCRGTGRIVEVQRTVFGSMQTQTTCPDCGGAGVVIDKPCETCGGQGRTPSRETVEVRVPAGVHAGQSITISDKGEAGVRGERCGNLQVRVDVLEHETFQRQGDDLYCLVTIDSFQAILGATVTVGGIMAGEVVEVVIPMGCQHGQQIAVPGMGMPRMSDGRRGNLVAVVDITTPTDLTEAQMKALRAVAVEHGSVPREGVGIAVDEGEDSEASTSKKAWHFRGRKR